MGRVRLSRRALPTRINLDVYEVVSRALEAGIARGVRRGRRSKQKGGMEDALFRACMDEIQQVMRFEEFP